MGPFLFIYIGLLPLIFLSLLFRYERSSVEKNKLLFGSLFVLLIASFLHHALKFILARYACAEHVSFPL